MKGIVLTVFGLVLVASTAIAGDAQFGVIDSSTPKRDLAWLLVTPKTSDPLAQLVPYDRTDVRGGKPTIAYTVFRFTSQSAEFSLQPVMGQINGAQVQVSF